jgi:hypothetical protein
MPVRNSSRATLEYLSVDKLDFDPSNPRFAAKPNKHDQDNLQRLLTEAPYFALELVDSLVKNGYIDYEPIVVKKAPGGRYTVIEGNRRLAAIKEILANPDKYKDRKESLDKVPALIFPENPDTQQSGEMRIFLGVRHLIGFREWPPLSKAAFLDRLSRQAGSLNQVLQELRITKNNAKRLLLPYRLLNKAGRPIPEEEDFWTLGEAMTRAGVKEFLSLDIDDSLQIVSFDAKRFSHLLDFLYGKESSKGIRDAASRKVSETRELSKFAKVIKSESAYKALLKGDSLADAEIHVDTSQESIDRLRKVVGELKKVSRKLIGKSDAKPAKQLANAVSNVDDAVSVFIKGGVK